MSPRSPKQSKFSPSSSLSPNSDIGGFSNVKSEDMFASKFPDETIFTEKSYCLKENFNLSQRFVNDYFKLANQFIMSSVSVIDWSNEKVLCFPIFDILRIPLFMSKSRLEINESNDEGAFSSIELVDNSNDDGELAQFNVFADKQLDELDDADNADANIAIAYGFADLKLSHEGAIKHGDARVKGHVEFLVKKGNDITFIIEAKSSSETKPMEKWHGYYQLKSEMMVALLSNSSSTPTVYGALTSLTDWYFMKLTRMGDSFTLTESVSPIRYCQNVSSDGLI
jgi:hypothetical protein